MMFAATAPSSDRILDSLKLALRLEASRNASPDKLREYLIDTVRRSLSLLERPSIEAASAPAEAVSLAFMLSSDTKLKSTFEDLLAGAKPEIASAALSGLEEAFDADREPAYFGRKVSTII